MNLRVAADNCNTVIMPISSDLFKLVTENEAFSKFVFKQRVCNTLNCYNSSVVVWLKYVLVKIMSYLICSIKIYVQLRA